MHFFGHNPGFSFLFWQRTCAMTPEQGGLRFLDTGWLWLLDAVGMHLENQLPCLWGRRHHHERAGPSPAVLTPRLQGGRLLGGGGPRRSHLQGQAERTGPGSCSSSVQKLDSARKVSPTLLAGPLFPFRSSPLKAKANLERTVYLSRSWDSSIHQATSLERMGLADEEVLGLHPAAQTTVHPGRSCKAGLSFPGSRAEGRISITGPGGAAPGTGAQHCKRRGSGLRPDGLLCWRLLRPEGSFCCWFEDVTNASKRERLAKAGFIGGCLCA